MYGRWTEYAVLWKTSFGFIWDILNLLKIFQNSDFGGGYIFRISFLIIK